MLEQGCWRMTGDNGNNPIGGVYALLMDTMGGPDFERGLGKLKAAPER